MHNPHQAMQTIIADLTTRPRLLLHVCCAPCSTAVLQQLHPHFAITAYYYNPNIDTQEEYIKRAREEEQFVLQSKLADAVVAEPYTPDEYQQVIRGLENEPEGGARCTQCFRLRLAQSARYAKAHGYDYFTTTLTISPLKNASLLNAIGQEMAETYGVAFLPSDFKKQDGYRHSVALSKEYGLYRQDYCGCLYSKREREKKKAASE